MNVLFIDPLMPVYNFSNSAGIAYLRGFLEDREVKTSVINFNYLKNDTYFLNKYSKVLFAALLKEKKTSIDYLDFRNLLREIHELPFEGIEKVVNKVEVLDNIFKKKIGDLSEFKFLGISIVFPYQVLFVLALVLYIRKRNNKIKIVLGGQGVQMALNDYLDFFEKKPIVDYLIIGAGEYPFYSLIKGSTDISQIPNLYYLDNGKYYFSKQSTIDIDMEKISSPIFEKDDNFFLQASRKCYWNKCAFCSVNRFDSSSVYCSRTIDKLVKDVDFILSRSNRKINNIMFTDGAVSPVLIRNISKKILSSNRKRNISLSAFVRAEGSFDLQTFLLAKKAGFSCFVTGIEALTPRVFELINKGVSIDNYSRIFKIAEEAEIEIQLNFIINFPTQAEHELIDELNQIINIIKVYKNIYVFFSFFDLMSSSEVFQNPQKFGIEKIEKISMKFFDDYSYFMSSDSLFSDNFFMDLIVNTLSKNLSYHEKKRINIKV